jgi:DNA-binding response OmpR family regulator
MRVLLAEDDTAAANGIALMPKSGGAVVDTADTDEKSLSLFGTHDDDIAVLDLMLPDTEGRGIVQRNTCRPARSPL